VTTGLTTCARAADLRQARPPRGLRATARPLKDLRATARPHTTRRGTAPRGTAQPGTARKPARTLRLAVTSVFRPRVVRAVWRAVILVIRRVTLVIRRAGTPAFRVAVILVTRVAVTRVFRPPGTPATPPAVTRVCHLAVILVFRLAGTPAIRVALTLASHRRRPAAVAGRDGAGLRLSRLPTRRPGHGRIRTRAARLVAVLARGLGQEAVARRGTQRTREATGRPAAGDRAGSPRPSESGGAA